VRVTAEPDDPAPLDQSAQNQSKGAIDQRATPAGAPSEPYILPTKLCEP